jgi:hypothetical protein
MMVLSKISEETGEEAAGTPLSQIVIEGRIGEPGTMLHLRVDARLIATNLTTAQIKFFVCELLDRIDGKATDSRERQLH